MYKIRSALQRVLTFVHLPRRHPFDAQVVHALRAHGYVLLSNISKEDFFDIGYRMGTIERHPDADPETGITVITSDSSNLSYEDGRTAQPYHTDGTAVAEPPNVVLLYCDAQAEQGGESFFSDAQEVYADLKRSDPQLLALMCTEPVLFGDPKRPQVSSPIFTVTNGRAMLRFRDDGFLTYPPALESRIDDIRAAFARHDFRFKMKKGEGYIALNKRAAHGRTAFEGDVRRMERLLIHYAPKDARLKGIEMDFLAL